MKTGIAKHDERSERVLETAHPIFREVFGLTADALIESGSDLRFVLIEGVRTMQRQRQLFASGASTVLKSRHLASPVDGLSRAVDYVPCLRGELEFAWPLYDEIRPLLKAASLKVKASDGEPLGERLEHGADWRKFKDGPHVQLNAKLYP